MFKELKKKPPLDSLVNRSKTGVEVTHWFMQRSASGTKFE